VNEPGIALLPVPLQFFPDIPITHIKHLASNYLGYLPDTNFSKTLAVLFLFDSDKFIHRVPLFLGF